MWEHDNQLVSYIKSKYYYLNYNSKYNSVFLLIFFNMEINVDQGGKNLLHIFIQTDYCALYDHF